VSRDFAGPFGGDALADGIGQRPALGLQVGPAGVQVGLVFGELLGPARQIGQGLTHAVQFKSVGIVGTPARPATVGVGRDAAAGRTWIRVHGRHSAAHARSTPATSVNGGAPS